MVLYLLDREVGINVGYFGVTSGSRSLMTVMGFPADARLDSYVAHADSRLFHRFREVTEAAPGDHYDEDLWLFLGETGAPSSILCVHRHTQSRRRRQGIIGTGCVVYAAKVKDVSVDTTKLMKGQPSNRTLQPWTAHLMLAILSDTKLTYTTYTEALPCAASVVRSIIMPTPRSERATPSLRLSSCKTLIALLALFHLDTLIEA